MKSTFLFITSFFCILVLNACYYDNFEKLNPYILTNDCDTAGTISFSQTIRPILQNNCTNGGCHTANQPDGGYTLDHYAGVTAVASSGQLYDAITWSGGASPMPKNSSSKISDCNIESIRKWIQQGALNN